MIVLSVIIRWPLAWAWVVEQPPQLLFRTGSTLNLRELVPEHGDTQPTQPSL